MESHAQNSEDHMTQLNELRRRYGWDGVQKIQQWNKDMLRRAGRDDGLLDLARQLTAEEQESGGNWKPRNKKILEEIARKFPGFTWWVDGQSVKIRNYPTTQGENPTLFDLLIMPPSLADGYVGYTKTKTEEHIRALRIGEGGGDPWTMKASDFAMELPREAIDKCLVLIKGWKKVFPRESTFVRRKFGTPSLLVRIDCVVDKEGMLGVYEIEERPAGVGITTLVNEQFRELFAQVRVEWPQFSVVISPKRRHRGDDYLWVSEIPLEAATNNDDLVLVRAEPEEQEFHVLAPRSVSVVRTKGLKSYGVPLGLWQGVDASSQCLPWEEGFCLKPLQGSKLRDIEIWDPIGNSKGVSSRASILGTLQRKGEMYCQSLIRPMRWDIQGKAHDSIYRIFFGYSPKSKRWVALGGSWNARPAPCLRIHGTPETIIGPAILSS
ncbi:MAG: hypothetical protein WAP23_02920 [Candidatus Spechtbacterales bacterium]